jgi:hypothetical protein
MDLYRLEKKSDLEQIGFGDYVDSGHLCLIEWPALGSDYFVMPYVQGRDRRSGITKFVISRSRHMTQWTHKYGFGLETMPEKVATAKGGSQFTIGIPSEGSHNENRVAIVPHSVKPLVLQGHKVLASGWCRFEIKL